MKTEIMQKIIEKQDDIIQVYYNQSEIYTDMGHKIVAGLLDELASLKSQLAEAGEEDVYTKSLRLLTEFMDKTPSEEKTELKNCINCKYREAVCSDIMCDNCYYHRHWEPR